MEKFFKLKEKNTDVKTEIIAGFTTFMTMAYILAVNPVMLAETGMDPNGVFTASALAASLATMIMGLYANYPFALAPGMGLNAYFTYTVVAAYGYSWQFALTAVFIEGLIFIFLSFFKVRELIFNAIPKELKNAVSAGIGLFIAFIGVTSAGIVQTGSGTITELANITQPQALLALIGLIITGILLAKNIKGAILIGIVITTLVGIPLNVTTIPEGFKIFSLPSGMSNVAFQFVGFEEIFTSKMFLVVFTFLFVDMFDTVGTLAGVASKTGMLDENGELPRVERALMADAVGTVFGAAMGTSTVTTYVESSAGVAEGGRTGLTAVTTSILFFLALFFSDIFLLIPAAATAPALIIVGLFMISPITEIDWSDLTVGLPAFLTLIMMPFAYSIAEGIVFGMISYTIIKTLAGKRKDVSLLMYVLSVIFILRYAFVAFK